MSDQLFFETEPIIGWRAWSIAETLDGPELRSIVYAHSWLPAEPFRMLCEPGGCLAARWPAQSHACGVHAFKHLDDALAFPSTWESRRFSEGGVREQYVIGQVSLWGRVIEHERGYRGQNAYPFAFLLAPEQERLTRVLVERYGVDLLPA